MRIVSGHILALGLMLLVLSWASGACAQSNALDFDGVDDRVSAGLPAIFTDPSNNSFTIATWVRPAGGGVTARVFFAQQSPTQVATVLLNPSNVPYFYVVHGGTTTSVNSQVSLPNNQWSHVAARWNHASQTADIFINGEATNGISGGITSTGSDGVMMIGARSDDAQVFAGRLDDLHVWSTVRTQQQLRAEMTGTCWDTAGLIAAYDFNQGVAAGDNAGVTNLPDVSSGGFNGTLLGFALNGAASNWLASDSPVAEPGLVFDPPLPSPIETSEDGSGFATTVRLSAAPEDTLTVTVSSNDSSEGAAMPLSLDFTPETWNTPQAISFVGVDDADVDGAVDYAFDVSFSGAAGACWTSLTDTLAASNLNDDVATVSAGGTSIDEGNVGTTSLVFDVALDVDYPGGFSLPFSTVDDTALAGIDYLTSNGTLIFNGSAGETQQVSVTVLSNTQSQENRRLLLTFGTPDAPGIEVVPSQVEGLILDDDIDLSVQLTPGEPELLQGASTGYSVRVENHSPQFDALNVLVDSLSIPALEGTQWNCSAVNGATCSPSGAGEPSESIDVPAGSHVIFEVTGSVPASGSNQTESIELLTSITTEVADSDPSNDSDAATLTVFSNHVFSDAFETLPPPEG